MMPPAARQDTDPGGLTVAEAAAQLEVTPDAVRRRLHRGTLAGVKASDGQWRVWLPEQPPGHAPGPAPGERQDIARTPPAQDALIARLESENAYLRVTLDAEIEARRRADHLVAGLMERLPELAATVEDAAQDTQRAPTAHERREAFWHTPAGPPSVLRGWIRRLVGR
jgi:hypothetical protein